MLISKKKKKKVALAHIYLFQTLLRVLKFTGAGKDVLGNLVVWAGQVVHFLGVQIPEAAGAFCSSQHIGSGSLSSAELPTLF